MGAFATVSGNGGSGGSPPKKCRNEREEDLNASVRDIRGGRVPTYRATTGRIREQETQEDKAYVGAGSPLICAHRAQAQAINVSNKHEQ